MSAKANRKYESIAPSNDRYQQLGCIAPFGRIATFRWRARAPDKMNLGTGKRLFQWLERQDSTQKQIQPPGSAASAAGARSSRRAMARPYYRLPLARLWVAQSI